MKRLLSLCVIFICAYTSVYAQCTVPTSVTINGPAAISICEGTALTLSGSVLVPGAPQNTSFTYSWKKIQSVDLVASADIVISANTATALPNYTGITGTIADAGTYVLRVEDGNTGNASCYTEASVVVKVNPKPVITSASTGTICERVQQNYQITSDISATYTWSRANVTGITSAARVSTDNPITETLTNYFNTTPIVRYVITPTSTTGNCVGTAFNYDLTVNPQPRINSATTGAICTGIPQNYVITSIVPSTYIWSRAAVTGVANASALNQTSNSITETLTNITDTSNIVRYVITPTSTTGNCVGTAFNYDVAVVSHTVITSPATDITCSGIAQNYSITSIIPSTYTWSRAAVTGVTNATVTNITSNKITEILTNTTSVPITVRYIITPTSITAGCPGIPFNYDVTVNPQPVITSAVAGTICSGQSQNYLITSDIAATYTWSRATVAGITNAAATYQASNMITETVYNSTETARVVRYVITPTSTTGFCAGAAFNYNLTVNPLPLILSFPYGQTICNGASPEYEIKSNIASSYSWTRAEVPAINGGIANSGSSNLISETLTIDNTITSETVRYTITATSLNGCAGKTLYYDVTVTNEIPPTVSITANTGSTICTGTSVTFKATPSNGGASPAYAWTSSGSAGILSTTDTYTSNSLFDGEVITATITSSLDCAVPKVAADDLKMTVWSAGIVPSVTIAADKSSICSGNQVIFTATATNAIATPSYEWFVESGGSQVSQGIPSSTNYFITSALQPNDKVFVKITSNDICANSTPVSSASLAISVNVGISAGTIGTDQTICYGTTPAELTELTASDAVSPTYEWEQSVNPALSAWVPATGTRDGTGFTPQGTYTSDIYLRRAVIDATLPSPCKVAISSPVHITVVPCSPFSSAITGTTSITPGQQNVSYSVPFQSGMQYVWVITGGTVISGQDLHAIIVDWDKVTGIAMARTTAPSYSVSVTETNAANESKTTTMELNTTTTASTTSLAQSGIQFYPNPSTDAFNIVMPQSGTLVQYNITDLSGMSVASGSFTSTGGAEKIATNFNTGLYQVVLTYNETVTCLRLNKVQ